jgi:hypothetical protein
VPVTCPIGRTTKASGGLSRTGISRSEAIRRAILDSAGRLRKRSELAAEVAALEADDEDRREMLEVSAFMESMRAALWLEARAMLETCGSAGESMKERRGVPSR